MRTKLSNIIDKFLIALKGDTEMENDFKERVENIDLKSDDNYVQSLIIKIPDTSEKEKKITLKDKDLNDDYISLF